MKQRTNRMPLEVEAARREIFSRAAPLPAERVPLHRAHGRILRESAQATGHLPRFDVSSMDGFAARSTDLRQPLRLVGEVRTGSVFSRPIETGQCVRIFTGAAMPAGADCVVPRENAICRGRSVRVERRSSVSHIRRKGENVRTGELLISAGVRLGAPELAALAAAGIARPVVTRAPRCVHLVMGDELVPPSRKPAGAQVRDSNSTLIATLLADRGALLRCQAIARDDLASATQALQHAGEHDVLLISGGAGLSDCDLAEPLLRELGFTVHFRQVNLRPGKPLMFGSRGRCLAFALPGNPVSHWVVFQLFVGPLLNFLQGGDGNLPPMMSGLLAAGTTLPTPDSRATYWPCRLAVRAGVPTVVPLPLASSGDAVGLVGACALLPLLNGRADLCRMVSFIPCP